MIQDFKIEQNWDDSGKLFQMHLTPKRVGLDGSTKSKIKDQIKTFKKNLYFSLFDYLKWRCKLFPSYIKTRKLEFSKKEDNKK